MMIAVVITANLISLMSSLRFLPVCNNGTFLGGLESTELGPEDRDIAFGCHLRTASTLARQGWTWSGYENMTSTTMAARPIVAETDGAYCATILPPMSLPKER